MPRTPIISALSMLGLAALTTLHGAGPASAHPLGNFTTNTALVLRVAEREVSARYVVDIAEIPALRITQQLGAAAARPAGLQAWAAVECRRAAGSVAVTVDDSARTFQAAASSASRLDGQAGLQTIRLECDWRSAGPTHVGSAISVVDSNYADLLGWREVTVLGAGTAVRTTAPATSPTALLRSYPTDATLRRDLTADLIVESYAGIVALPPLSAENGALLGTPVDRSSDGLTDRFQSLVAREQLTFGFIVGALMIAVVLGSAHALAPGHGKSMMAAYVIGRRGGRRDLVLIGVTVALTHTTGVIVLGSLAAVSSAFLPERVFPIIGMLSGLLVVGVGVSLLGRRRHALRDAAPAAPEATPPHDHHDHQHDHEHDHDHDHDHEHQHDHDRQHDHDHDHPHDESAHRHDRSSHSHHHEAPRHRRRGRTGAGHGPDATRWIVTSHRHGGSAHTHVLPRPGVDIARRELIVMGLAGGLLPSPSAVLVLLAAVTLGRVWLGLGLVLAYGVGLALTLIGAGLLMATIERRFRRLSVLSTNGHVAMAVRALPIASAAVLIGGGLLVAVRALGELAL